ncbi:hypothetical protein HN587_06135 [Candidatus Woesearchaeota archaeon]|jgi:hypothetical protein|nr:hypothetical protein [Candidatus Woesearchaeota archaeon]
MQLFKNKRAEDGTKAATLVALIALLIIFYLLFIPPQVRQNILEGDYSEDSKDSGDDDKNTTLLLETPGTLTTISTKDIEHSIAPVNIFASENSKVIDTQNSLSVKKSWFSDKTGEFSFVVQDLSQTENLLLTFVSKLSRGNLQILLNGEEIFNQAITKENPDPIKLSSKYLAQGANSLEFITEDVGLAFWRVNKHNLENLQITGDITDISQQLSRNIFIASATEKNNLKRGKLVFTPECSIGSVGALQALINNHIVYDAVPDCGFAITVEFSPDILRNGENQIVFKTIKGNYLIDLIKIKSELKEIIQPVYFFDLDEDEFSDVQDESDEIYLEITFIDSQEYHIGKANINGIETNIHQKERVYSKKINDYLVKGNNAIKITPEDILQIVKLEVVRKD